MRQCALISMHVGITVKSDKVFSSTILFFITKPMPPDAKKM